MAFIADGGYARPELWLSLGWDAVQARGWNAPLYWSESDDGGGWSTFTLHGRVPVDEHAPVAHVSFFEADAYARWAGARLPTEHEWEALACSAPIAGNFAEARAFEPLPAARHAAHDAPAQLFGDVWEWTRSEYAPYPGFRVAPRRGRRVQRQVHVQPVRAARRLVRDAALAHPRDLPQLLPAGSAMAVQRDSPGAVRRSARCRAFDPITLSKSRGNRFARVEAWRPGFYSE